MMNVLVTLKENRAMVDWSINEDVEEEVVEVERKVGKSPPKQQFFCVTEKCHIVRI
jgi:hypothetical protein